MVDKINMISTSNAQKSRNFEGKKIDKVDNTSKAVTGSLGTKQEKVNDISDAINISRLKEKPPIDMEKVSNIKEAIAKGNYPIDLERISDALMQAYEDIK